MELKITKDRINAKIINNNNAIKSAELEIAKNTQKILELSKSNDLLRELLEFLESEEK